MINILIPHYKHQCYLPDAIAALKNQSVNVRILLMNDDPKVDLSNYEATGIGTYRIPSSGNHQEIFVCQDGVNRGQSFRFNQGIHCSMKSSSYPANWVTFHGADDIAMPWKMSALNDIIYQEDYDILYTDAVELNANSQRTYIKSEEFDIDILKRRNFIVVSTVFVRTELAAEVLFDEDLRYGEDWLFYHKMHKAGARFKYVPIPTIYYRDYTSNVNVRYGPDWDANRRKIIDKIKGLYK